MRNLLIQWKDCVPNQCQHPPSGPVDGYSLRMNSYKSWLNHTLGASGDTKSGHAFNIVPLG